METNDRPSDAARRGDVSTLMTFRAAALARLTLDARIAGVLEAGAGAAGRLDRYSDLDFVLVASEGEYESLLAGRVALAESLGPLLACFTGEHVGEPRLLICLFETPSGDHLLHVDLKVVRAEDLAHRVDDPLIHFDRTGAAGDAMAATKAVWPERTPQWFEDRIWIWLHYAAARAARGELFEAIDSLGFIRGQVLAPMLSARAGLPQRGLRHIEKVEGAAAALTKTLAQPSRDDVRQALAATANLYRALREHDPPASPRRRAEDLAIAYVDRVLRRPSA
jgi:hypothetical protein